MTAPDKFPSLGTTLAAQVLLGFRAMASARLSSVSRFAQCAALVGILCALGGWVNGRDLLLYNQSASVPPGLYQRIDAAPLLGAYVTVRASDVAPAYALARDFTDAGDRFIKRIAATAGAEICVHGTRVSIDGATIGARLVSDREGRALPSWSGCRLLARDEFLLLGDTGDSFDGRYWGPVSLTQIEGVWRPLRP